MPDQTISDEVLLQICDISPTDEGYSDDLVPDLHCVLSLARERGFRSHEYLDHAVALLTSVLARYARQRFRGQQTMEWVESEDVEVKAKQIVGLLWSKSKPSEVAKMVSYAIEDAINHGLIHTRRYDAWHPGMTTGTGQRQSFAATAYGVIRARQLYSQENEANSAGSAATAGSQKQPAEPVAPAPATTGAAAPAIDAIPEPDTPDNTDRVAGTGAPPSEEARYEWARQAELVRATNQVLSEGMLDKGVLSKACAEQHIETNGIPGRGSLVKVSSFLAWVAKKCDLAKDEQTQVRNAIIGEISTRNS